MAQGCEQVAGLVGSVTWVQIPLPPSGTVIEESWPLGTWLSPLVYLYLTPSEEWGHDTPRK